MTKKTRIIVSIASIACQWLSLVTTITAQKTMDESICGQTLQFKNELIDRIDPLEYTFRRIEFTGNVHTNDKELKKKILFAEADIFKREHLIQSITKMSKVNKIQPITLKNVGLFVDDAKKDVDVVFCVRESPR